MIFTIPIKKYKEANRYKRRDCYAQLEKYIQSDSTKVCSIFGLRRTGKSTMMFQAMSDIGLENSGYILCEEGDSYGKLCQKLDEYILQNKKAIFIDEITKIPTFLSSSASLADYYSGTGSKIIITGTDSLGLNLAARGELYDRTESIHTTYISYGEFSRLIEKTDVDDFIHYAGVLSHEEDVKEREFYNRKTASHYIDTAISSNITNTFFHKNLPCNFIHRYDKLIGMHNRDTLIPTITSIVEMYSGVITKDVLDAYFHQIEYANIDVSSALDLLEKHNIFINRDKFTEDFEAQIAFSLNSRRDINDKIEEESVLQIKEYLSDLELLVKVPLVRHNDNNPKREYTYETEEYIYQAGMKYCQAKAIIDILKGSNELNLSPIEKESLCKKIEEDVKGQILEVTAFNDVQRLLDDNKYDIFKMQFIGKRDGEIDMIIYDKEEKSYYCFEIKHASQIEEHQQKNLIYKPYYDVLNANYGTRKGVAVLYRGNTTSSPQNGVDYLNIGDFLSEVYSSKDKNMEHIIWSCIHKCKQTNEYTFDNHSKNDNSVVGSETENMVNALSQKADGISNNTAKVIAEEKERIVHSATHNFAHTKPHHRR